MNFQSFGALQPLYCQDVDWLKERIMRHDDNGKGAPHPLVLAGLNWKATCPVSSPRCRWPRPSPAHQAGIRSRGRGTCSCQIRTNPDLVKRDFNQNGHCKRRKGYYSRRRGCYNGEGIVTIKWSAGFSSAQQKEFFFYRGE